MLSHFHRWALLAGAACLIPVPASGQQQPAGGQASEPTQTGAGPAAQPSEDYGDEEEAIVVTGAKPRGSVVGDIPPEKTLDARDVRATGATSITELLDALAPEIGSARGRSSGAPVLLLNGQRISSFREMRDIPVEAIQRVEILPEEVALKYGYRADQRVVNIVLRQRFRSTAVQLAGTAASEGGYAGGTGDLTRLMIGRNGRTTVNLHAEGNGLLTENERDIELEPSPSPGSSADSQGAQSLIASQRLVRGSTTFNRTIFGDVSATLNTELQHNERKSLIGLSDTFDPLGRNTTSDNAHAGTTLSGDTSGWRWNVTGNADLQRDVTGTDQEDPTLPDDRTRARRVAADLTGTANGTLFRLPAGNATATFTLGGNTQHLDSERRRLGVTTSNDLGRTSGQAAVNVDLPISRRNRDFSALGKLTLNANAEVDQLSDFGTLTTIGAGANWSPVERLNLITSWTREEGAPTIQQLGNPILETPNTRIFDFTTGETVRAIAITGGNPDLLADRRNVLKVGGNWQPFPKLDLRLRADYVHSVIDRPIQNIFGPTPALEEAFPGRFVRDLSGQLVSADLRPLNLDQARRDTLRLGFDFTRPLKSRRPSQATLDRFRQDLARAGVRAPGGSGSNAGPRPQGGGSSAGGRQGFGGRGGGGGGFFGGGNRGRLQFSLTDTITFVDKVSIGPGLPELDYLHGDAAGSSGGTPQHQIQAQAGWYNNGFGARLGANWRSGTRVDSLIGDDLKFSPLATFDLRLFANLGDQFDLVAKHPWLRGSSVQFQAKNLFDAKPKVHDAAGKVPLNYQPDLLDPIGRTVMISFRKLFLPPPRFVRRLEQQQPPPGEPQTQAQ